MQRSKAAGKALQDCFNTCAYCDKEMTLEYGKPESITFEHVVAKSGGGRWTLPSCFNCNSLKGSRPLFPFLLELHNNDAAKATSIFNTVARMLPRHDSVLLSNQHKYLRVPVGKTYHSTTGRSKKPQSKDQGSISVTRLPVQGELFKS